MDKPVIFLDMDGTIADFAGAYKAAFNRDAYEDDPFTVNQFCLQQPNFFRGLSVLPKGRELFDLLKDDYRVVFLTTPMKNMTECRRDKAEWIKENFGNYDIIFSDNKADFVQDEKSVLIDDMEYNLKPWSDAGGTAIDIKERIDRIFEIIEETLYGKKAVAEVKEQLEKMTVNLTPTEKQKESGNYKKGDIIFKGLKIKIENTPGSWRFGWDADGRKWISRMKCLYGYITGTEGNDYDPIDCFIGNKLNASRAFVVNQMTADNMFDEHKVVLGCDNLEEARKLYLSNYQKGWESRIGSIAQTNTKKLRSWLEAGNKTEAYK